ncbi:hypothetical protein M378DRAFT_170019, partial [Amanita muscaria Koide BX008]
MAPILGNEITPKVCDEPPDLPTHSLPRCPILTQDIASGTTLLIICGPIAHCHIV